MYFTDISLHLYFLKPHILTFTSRIFVVKIYHDIWEKKTVIPLTEVEDRNEKN